MQKLAGVALILIGLAVLTPLAISKPKKTRFSLINPIVVNVKREGGHIEYSLDGKSYSGKELNFQLAEMHLDSAPHRRAFVMLDEGTTYISDIKVVPQMLVNAGFTDMQVFVVFAKAGNMAEIVYGPVKRISDHPDAH